MTKRTMNRILALRASINVREVETFSGRTGRVVAVGFANEIIFVDNRDGSVHELRPFSFARIGS